MNITQLETFITVSKLRSFRKAAELLNLTQPAVSAQIRSLENEFEIVLLDRNQPVTLTDSGVVFVEHAVQILDSVEKLKRKLQDLDVTPQGHIHIGTTTSIAIQILPRVLSYFQNQYPLIHTTIHTMPSTQIMAQVDDGSIDIGIAYLMESNPSILSSVLYYDTFELVVSPENTLAKREHISAQELHDTPFIMLSPDTSIRRFVDQLFQKYQLDPPIVMELSSSEEVKRMVELDLGAAIISKMTIGHELLQGKLKIIKIDELIATHPVAIMVKSGRYLNSAMEQFLDDLKGMSESQFYGSE